MSTVYRSMLCYRYRPVTLVVAWLLVVQVELFIGAEMIDDNLSLVDVAYIYMTRKVQHMFSVLFVS